MRFEFLVLKLLMALITRLCGGWFTSLLKDTQEYIDTEIPEEYKKETDLLG